MGISIAGHGYFIPRDLVFNQDLEKASGFPPGWIERRTGFKSRAVAPDGMALSDLAVMAGRQALRGAKLAADDIGLLLLATSTPDYLLPPSAPKVARELGLDGAGAIDLAGACSGFLYALSLGEAHCRARREAVLVIGGNILSRRVDPRDMFTAALFGDGAGALVLLPHHNKECLLSVFLSSNAPLEQELLIPEGGSKTPFNETSHARKAHLMHLEWGSRLFRKAVLAMAEAGREALRRARLTPDQLDWWIPHQANGRLVAELANHLAVPSEKIIFSLEDCGNCSAGTIPIALSRALEKGTIRPGQKVLLTAVGSGMTIAGLVLEI